MDIWALGVMTYFLLAGAHIWPAGNRDELKDMILQQDPNLDVIVQKHGRTAANFISKCLEKDQNDRPAADELLNDIWFKDIRVSSYSDTAFNSAFTHIYSYSKVDNFTTAICSTVAKHFIQPKDEAELRRIFDYADSDKTGTLDEKKLYNAMSEVCAENGITEE